MRVSVSDSSSPADEKRPHTPRRILSLTDACSYVGLSRVTMYRLLKENAIPAFKVPGGRNWKFQQSDLDAWLQTGEWRGKDASNH